MDCHSQTHLLIKVLKIKSNVNIVIFHKIFTNSLHRVTRHNNQEVSPQKEPARAKKSRSKNFTSKTTERRTQADFRRARVDGTYKSAFNRITVENRFRLIRERRPLKNIICASRFFCVPCSGGSPPRES